MVGGEGPSAPKEEELELSLEEELLQVSSVIYQRPLENVEKKKRLHILCNNLENVLLCYNKILLFI